MSRLARHGVQDPRASLELPRHAGMSSGYGWETAAHPTCYLAVRYPGKCPRTLDYTGDLRGHGGEISILQNSRAYVEGLFPISLMLAFT